MSDLDKATVNLGDLVKIEAKPGDTFVLTLAKQIPLAEVEKLRTWWAKHMPDYRLIILEKGMTLGHLISTKPTE